MAAEQRTLALAAAEDAAAKAGKWLTEARELEQKGLGAGEDYRVALDAAQTYFEQAAQRIQAAQRCCQGTSEPCNEPVHERQEPRTFGSYVWVDDERSMLFGN